MASYGYGQAADNTNALKAEIKTLTVERLKTVLRNEGLTVSGVKSELQIRLISHVEKTQTVGDRARLDRIRSQLKGNHHPGHYGSPHTPQSSASPQQFYSPHLKPPVQGHSYNMPNRNQYGSTKPRFADSPFYKIERPLSDVVDCKARETTRDTARITLQLPTDVAQRLMNDDNLRVMVFCAAENITHSIKTDISFPHQVELKCNDSEVKANLKGLKNKPGSTRPADITSLLRKKVANYSNVVEMVYALTNKEKPSSQRFYMVINLVQKRPVDQLVAELRRGRSISKEQVLREMQTRASDPDIVATSSIMSLKCPLSFTRLRTPCRGMACTHNQCFDATSFLQLQEQAPTWTCPTCNKSATWEHLVLDQYVQSILDSTKPETDQVTVEPDGQWSLQGAVSSNLPIRKSNPTPSDDEDDDIVVVSNNRPQEPRNPFQAMTPSSVRTPPLNSSREASAVTSGSASRASTKRPREVIDLTLDDDDEEMPPIKKTMSSSQNGSFRARPPDRYQFNFPPPLPPPSFNYDSGYDNGADGSSSPSFY